MRSIAIVFLLLVTAWTAVSMRSAGIPLVLHRQWPYEEHPGQLQPRPRCFFGPLRPGAVLQVLRVVGSMGFLPSCGQENARNRVRAGE